MKRFLPVAFFLLTLSASVALPTFAAESVAVRHEITSSEPSMTSRRGAIEITCPVNGHTYTFQIYAITGQLVKRVQLTDTTSVIEIPQGCYIVKCESWVKKEIVH